MLLRATAFFWLRFMASRLKWILATSQYKCGIPLFSLEMSPPLLLLMMVSLLLLLLLRSHFGPVCA